MVSLKQVRGSRVSKARSASVTKSRVTVSRRAKSAPGRISLNKDSILRMTRTQAREALRSTTPMAFYRKGRMGLTLFALLLIVATRPVGALVNFAGAAGYGPGKTVAVPSSTSNKHWYDAFKLKEKSAAAQVAQQGALLTTAIATGSGTATTAVALSQFTASAYGQFIVAMFIVTYLISSVLRYGEARMARQSQKEQMTLIEKQMSHQTKMMELMLISRNRPNISSNRIAQMAIMNR
jgi:hypothetical protein